jgi:hypothetical protein
LKGEISAKDGREKKEIGRGPMFFFGEQVNPQILWEMIMNNLSQTATEKKLRLIKIVHARVKGRCRYQVKGLLRSESLKKYLEFKLATVPGIDYVCANVLTGKILLRFQEKHSTDHRFPDRKYCLRVHRQPEISHEAVKSK